MPTKADARSFERSLSSEQQLRPFPVVQWAIAGPQVRTGSYSGRCRPVQAVRVR